MATMCTSCQTEYARYVCMGCRGARYCTEECQRDDWRMGHRTACRQMAHIGSSGAGSSSMVPARKAEADADEDKLMYAHPTVPNARAFTLSNGNIRVEYGLYSQESDLSMGGYRLTTLKDLESALTGFISLVDSGKYQKSNVSLMEVLLNPFITVEKAVKVVRRRPDMSLEQMFLAYCAPKYDTFKTDKTTVYDRYQRAVFFAWCAYQTEYKRGKLKAIADAAKVSVRNLFSRFEARLGGAWEVVWGPAIYSEEASKKQQDEGEPDLSVFVFENNVTKELVVSFAGSRPGKFDWLNINARVRAPEKSPFSSDKNMVISPGMKTAYDELVKITPSELSVTLAKFIETRMVAAKRDHRRSFSVDVVGHSLGGALAQLMAVYIYNELLDEITRNKTTFEGLNYVVSCHPIAGYTPGNEVFAKYFNSILGKTTERIVNINDVVALAWDIDELAHVTKTYNRETSMKLLAILGTANILTGHKYKHTCATGQCANPPYEFASIEPSYESRLLKDEVLLQHSVAYFTHFGMEDEFYAFYPDELPTRSSPKHDIYDSLVFTPIRTFGASFAKFLQTATAPLAKLQDASSRSDTSMFLGSESRIDGDSSLIHNIIATYISAAPNGVNDALVTVDLRTGTRKMVMPIIASIGKTFFGECAGNDSARLVLDVNNARFAEWTVAIKKFAYVTINHTQTAEELAKRKLEIGENIGIIRFDGAVRCGEDMLPITVHMWPSDTRVVVSDIDGTITKSNILGFLLGSRWLNKHIVALYQLIANRGYRFVYLTNRTISLADSASALISDTLDDVQAVFPIGPVIANPAGFVKTIKGEFDGGVFEFKSSVLKSLRKGFGPNLWSGFGNTENDRLAYKSVQIDPGRTFIFNSLAAEKIASLLDEKIINTLFPLY